MRRRGRVRRCLRHQLMPSPKSRLCPGPLHPPDPERLRGRRYYRS